jgi:Mn-dependent DtxR family transcriptional regulator
VEHAPTEIHPCSDQTEVEARYLLTILDIDRSPGVPRTQAEVARRLGVSGPTALEKIRRLRTLGFVRPDALALTDAGMSAALVLRSRRAAAHALVRDVLGLDDELCSREADQLAGALSPSLGRRLVGRARRPRAKPGV